MLGYVYIFHQCTSLINQWKIIHEFVVLFAKKLVEISIRTFKKAANQKSDGPKTSFV